MYRLLFEQSGTFKRAFQKLGYEALDYDIRNDFNSTDYAINFIQEYIIDCEGGCDYGL